MYNIPAIALLEAIRDLAIEIATLQGMNDADAEAKGDEVQADYADRAHADGYSYLVLNGGNPALHEKTITLEIKPAEGVQLEELSDIDLRLLSYRSEGIYFTEAILEEDFAEAAKALAEKFLDNSGADNINAFELKLTIDNEVIEYQYGDETSGDFYNCGHTHPNKSRTAVFSISDAIEYLDVVEKVDEEILATTAASELVPYFMGYEIVEYHHDLKRFVIIDKPSMAA